MDSHRSMLSQTISHSSRADATRSRSDSHSSRMEEHWPLTDFFQSPSCCARESDVDVDVDVDVSRDACGGDSEEVGDVDSIEDRDRD